MTDEENVSPNPRLGIPGLRVGHEWGGQLRRMLANLPGAAYAEDQIHQAEDALLRELKARLERLDPPTRRPAARSTHTNGDNAAAVSAPVEAETAPEMLARLMEESTTQTRDEADNAAYARLLGSLLPDEARMLAALSDGEPHALVHLGVGPPVGPLTRRVATNLSAIGRTAQLRGLDHVPHYIDHLRHLGLVQIGPAVRALDLKYQVIENDQPVRALIAEIKQETGKNARFARHSVRISPQGRRLWDACQAGLDEGALGWGET